jgi:eukaryotic-like serine/threonine-protein kinase
MSAPEDPTQTAPQVLGGRYEIHRKLARGGMAEVYLARDRSLDRPVAVKVLFPEYATDPSFVERFRREAQAAANLTHPNIVGVYDWGTQSGTYFIVMEFVDGQSLAEIMRAAGPLHPQRAAEIAFEVAGALGFAHSRGVVHRDVKPGNVLISSGSGHAKVTDFGIARALESPSEDLTQAGSVMGTATYFSPEQAQGFAVDARSDLYSLGVVLYEMVCGRPPFSGDTPVSIAYKHVQEAPPRPTSIVSGIPEGLEAIIGKLLSKNPDSRYLSADDLRSDLRRYLDGETPAALEEYRRPIAGAAAAGAAAGAMAGAAMSDPGATTVLAPVNAGPPPDDDEFEDDEEDQPSRTGLFIGLLVALLVVAGLLAFWLVRSMGNDQVSVGNYVGLNQDAATQKASDDGLKPKVDQKSDDTAPQGQVFAQDPKQGTKVDKDSSITLTVSTGPSKVTVPGNLEGLNESDATKLLQAAGLTVTSEQQQSDTMGAGNVIGTNPPAGTEVPKNSPVTLLVSSGPATVPIPNVKGQTQAAARRALTNAGFAVSDVQTQASTDVATGRAIGTTPSGSAPRGAGLTLLVSAGPQQVVVPSVKGQSEASATAAIQAKGLDVNVTPKTVSSGDPNVGRVIDQDPSGGTSVDPNSAVTITVGVAGTSPTSTTTTTTSP